MKNSIKIAQNRGILLLENLNNSINLYSQELSKKLVVKCNILHKFNLYKMLFSQVLNL